MVKRKATANIKSGKIKRPTTTASKKQAAADTSSQHFRFFDLPAEIRTSILEYAAAHSGKGFLLRRHAGQLSSSDALSLVNVQLREEYLATLYGYASIVLIHVPNFDFRHLLTFFDKLTASEARTLPIEPAEADSDVPTRQPFTLRDARLGRLNHTQVPISSPSPPEKSERLFRAYLDFSPTGFWFPEHLLRWLEFLEAKGKVGSETVIEYRISSTEAAARWKGCREWKLATYSFPWTVRQKQELLKMKDAFPAPVRPAGRRDHSQRVQDAENERADERRVVDYLERLIW